MDIVEKYVPFRYPTFVEIIELYEVRTLITYRPSASEHSAERDVANIIVSNQVRTRSGG